MSLSSIMLLLTALVAVVLFYSLPVYSQSVAPGDASSYCLSLSGRQPTFSNEKVLLDTQNYRETTLLTANGLNRTWLSIDLDSVNGETDTPFTLHFLV